jgi:hypothetical protein
VFRHTCACVYMSGLLDLLLMPKCFHYSPQKICVLYKLAKCVLVDETKKCGIDLLFSLQPFFFFFLRFPFVCNTLQSEFSFSYPYHFSNHNQILSTTPYPNHYNHSIHHKVQSGKNFTNLLSRMIFHFLYTALVTTGKLILMSGFVVFIL